MKIRLCSKLGHWIQIMLTNRRFCPTCGKDLESVD
jgi:hypothetical protein